MKSASASSAVSPYDEIPREEWARLSQQTPLPLSEEDVTKLRGLGDRVDLHEVDAVYRPISRLLNIHVAAAQSLRHSRGDFLAQRQHRTPYVIAVAGSVAVGKSTTARLLRELMARWPDTPRVSLVTTTSSFSNEVEVYCCCCPEGNQNKWHGPYSRSSRNTW